MKYTVEGFDQATLVSLGLDAVDALILRWFVDFQGTGKMMQETVKDATYYWVFYQTVIDDIPCAGIQNRESIARRFKKLCNSGVIASYMVKDAKGSKTFYRLGQYYVSLVEPTRLESRSPTRLESRHIDSSIKEDNKRGSKKAEEQVYTEDELIEFKRMEKRANELYRPYLKEVTDED